jgi:hypothetical protein
LPQLPRPPIPAPLPIAPIGNQPLAPNIVVQVAVAQAPRAGDEEDDDVEIEEEGEEAPASGKRKRATRKLSYWAFVENINGVNEAYCKCGCLDADGVLRLRYAAPSTGAVKRHLEKHHKQFFSKFLACKDRNGNINELFELIEKANAEALEKAQKRRRRSDSFWAKSVQLEKEVSSNLRLLTWAVSCGVSRIALNDILFDAYHKSLGCEPPKNRHLLQDSYLPALDELLRERMVSDLKEVASVSLSSDGWRDNARRDWINIVIYWIMESQTPKRWHIKCMEPDLIFLPNSATADTIAYLIDGALEPIVHLISPFLYIFFCL